MLTGVYTHGILCISNIYNVTTEAHMDFENAIDIKNLTKRYDGFTLDNISFSVPKGSIMGFIGQNGAGKTTTINSLLNII